MDVRREKLLCLGLYLQEALSGGILKIKNKIIRVTDYIILYGDKKTKIIIYDENRNAITYYINKSDEKYILDSNYNIISFIDHTNKIVVFIKI